MRAISQFIIRVFDLIEAEGAALLTIVRGEAERARSAAVQLAMGLALLAVAVPLIITGFGFLTAGLLWLLETHVSRWLAAVLTGSAILFVGGMMLLSFALIFARRKP